MFLLQPDSVSNGPGRGGKYKSNGVDLRAKKIYTEAEAKQREKARVKERNAKKAGSIAKVDLPIEVRTAWEALPKDCQEGSLKAFIVKINSSPAEARATASLAESEAAVRNLAVQSRKESVRCNGIR